VRARGRHIGVPARLGNPLATIISWQSRRGPVDKKAARELGIERRLGQAGDSLGVEPVDSAPFERTRFAFPHANDVK